MRSRSLFRPAPLAALALDEARELSRELAWEEEREECREEGTLVLEGGALRPLRELVLLRGDTPTQREHFGVQHAFYLTDLIGHSYFKNVHVITVFIPHYITSKVFDWSRSGV